MKKIKIECHDCGEETVILDEYNDISEDDIQHCPRCGSTNSEIV